MTVGIDRGNFLDFDRSVYWFLNDLYFLRFCLKIQYVVKKLSN